MTPTPLDKSNLCRSPDPDLDWQAFLYLSGELPPAETESFEQQLADNQAAREAVARVVNLVGLLTSPAAPAPQVTRAAPPSQSRWGMLAGFITAAAIVFVCVSLFSVPRHEEASGPQELIGLWAGTDEPITERVADELEDSGELSLDVAADLTVPSWLLAAVEATSAQSNDEE